MKCLLILIVLGLVAAESALNNNQKRAIVAEAIAKSQNRDLSSNYGWGQPYTSFMTFGFTESSGLCCANNIGDCLYARTSYGGYFASRPFRPNTAGLFFFRERGEGVKRSVVWACKCSSDPGNCTAADTTTNATTTNTATATTTITTTTTTTTRTPRLNGLTNNQKKAIVDEAIAKSENRDLSWNVSSFNYGWGQAYTSFMTFGFTESSGLCCANNIGDCIYARTSYGIYFASRPFRPDTPGRFFFRELREGVKRSVVWACKCSSDPGDCTAADTTTNATTTNTATATTTDTTTATTTTTPTPRFCPDTSTTSTTTRLLGGTSITSCEQFPGLVSIVNPLNVDTTTCTAVITSPTTLSLPANCVAFSNGANVVAQDGTTLVKNLKVPAATTDGGAVTVTLDTPVDTGSCPGIACVYSASMADAILLDQCQVAAGGYSSNTEQSGGANFEYLDIPSLQPTDTCAAFLTASTQNFFFGTGTTYNCFFSPSGSTCQGDTGAPIVCPLTTGEQVVIGQVENMECSAGTVVGFYNLEEASVRVLAPKA